MTWLSPSAWNGVGIVSFIIVVAAFAALALIRGWLVLGIHHREIVAEKDRAIDRMSARAAADQDSISSLAETVASYRVAGELQAHYLEAVREAIASSRDREPS